MADTHSTRNRIVQQTVGGNSSTWGTLNNAALNMIDESLDGQETISITAGNVTLTTANNATDQARNRVLIFTGTPGTTRTVTAPDVEKWYIVLNNSDSTITFGAGAGTTVSILASSRAVVYCDGATNAAAFLNVASFAISLFDDASAAAARTTLGLAIGTDVQAFDAELAALAGLTSAADRLPYFTGSGTASLATFTAAGRALVDDADALTQRATLGLVIGTDVQAFDAGLAALAAFNTNGLLVQSANNTFVGRSVAGTANEITATNGDGVSGNPTLSLPTALTFTGKTITGGTFTGITDIAVADGGTGASTAATARANLGVAFSGAMVKKSADEVGANYSAGVVMTFNAEIQDVGGWHDNAVNNSRLTVIAGVTLVRVGANVLLSATTADTWKSLLILKNGTATFDGSCGTEQEAGDTGIILSLTSGVLAVTPGDYFEVRLLEESDASITITAARTNFWIEAVPA